MYFIVIEHLSMSVFLIFIPLTCKTKLLVFTKPILDDWSLLTFSGQSWI